ncbi:MAG: hypothetical protein OEW15_11560 [Nitrospirota bacterium]|nr:hypothetical protein [Nitrospirota bacterium]
MTQNQIETLRKIKKAILKSDAVVDVLWMDGAMPETVCEALDGLLIDAGVSADELEADYQGTDYEQR